MYSQLKYDNPNKAPSNTYGVAPQIIQGILNRHVHLLCTGQSYDENILDKDWNLEFNVNTTICS